MPFGPQPAADDVVLGLRFETFGMQKVIQDSQKIAKANIRWQSLVTKALKTQDWAHKKLAKGIKDSYLLSSRGVRNQIAANLKYRDSLEAIQSQIERNAAEIRNLAKSEKASTGETQRSFEVKRKGLELEGKLLENELQLMKKGKAKSVDARALAASKELGKSSKKAKEEVYDKFLSYKAGGDIGSGFKEAMHSLGARDMKGMAGGLLKAIGAAPKGLGAMAKRFEARQVEKGADAGKMGKVLGSLAGTLGNVVGMFAKLGPMLSMVGGLVMVIVKLFIDAEAAAKEFNKGVMATTSTTELLAKNGGDTDAAFEDLKDTMDEIRHAATDYQKNIAMGISKKQHEEFLSTLGAEGVSIRQIQKDAAAAKMSIGEFSTEMVHTAVAYSRVWGVSLSEITQLQGEMVSEFGMGLESVQQSFNMMNNAADESGIAANKFFSIIRSFTADMSLFNLRMEDAVLTLKMLGKAMSPRNAQKFMQTLTGFYKNQGLVERTGTVLKAGGAKKVGGMLQKDVTSRIVGMSNDVAAKIGDPKVAQELQDAVKAGPAATSKFMAKHFDKLDGSTQDAIMDAAITQGKLNKGGLVDVASALKDASPQATMKMWDMQAENLFHKPLSELTDVERLAYEQATGVSDEMQGQAIKAQMGMKTMKEALAYKLEHAGEEGMELTKEQLAMSEAMGLTGTKEEKAATVRGKSEEEIWGTMTELQRKQAMGTDDVKDYAQKQTEMLSTVQDKLDAILDAVMEWLYGIVESIADMLAQHWVTGGSQAERDRRRLAKLIKKEKDPTLSKALQKAGGDPSKFVAALTQEEGFKTLASALDSQTKTTAGLAAKQTFVATAFKKANVDEIASAVKMAGPEMEKKFGPIVRELQFKGAKPEEVEAALRSAGASTDDLAQIVGKFAWSMSPGKFADIYPDLTKDAGEAMKIIGKEANVGPLPSLPEGQTAAVESPPAEVVGPVVTPEIPEALGPVADGVEATADNTAAMQTNMEGVQQSSADLLDASTSQHTVFFKFPLPYLHGPFAKAVKGAVEDGTLKSLRTALFEYWMYSDMDKSKVAEWLKKGGSPEDFSSAATDLIRQTGKGGKEAEMPLLPGETAPANADGGVVAGVAGGMAVVKRPAPGEGFASIGKGEGITPTGGGGGSVVKVKLELSQDLKRVIRAEAADTVYEGKRRERFTG